MALTLQSSMHWSGRLLIYTALTGDIGGPTWAPADEVAEAVHNLCRTGFIPVPTAGLYLQVHFATATTTTPDVHTYEYENTYMDDR